jgi:3-hydroxyisobutyrate dehydrogenase
MSKIGFIGLGHMGLPMVANLVKQGYEVVVYDIAEQALKDATQFGATRAKSIKEVAQQVTTLFTMVQTGEQIRKICLSEDGILNSLPMNSLYIDSSSIDVMVCREIHETAAQKNIAMLDAPVSGGVAGAKAASLTIMVGGSEANFQRAKPILECVGKKIIHAGGAGNGQVAKICNNMILGISMIAVSEGFVLAKKLGLEPKKFFEIANNASGQCWSLSTYCPMPGVLENVPAANDFAPGFAANMMLKDLRLSQDAALRANAATPLGAEATALYTLFVNEGNAQLDFSGIIKLIAGNDLN